MMLRHLRGIIDKSRTEIEEQHPSAAVLDFFDGRVIPISDVATIGRAPESYIVLNERSISRHHARIFYESGHYWLKDLDSANGTTLNGKRIKQVQMLSNKDEVAFGEAKAVFRASDQPGPASIGNDPLEGEEPLSQDGTPTDALAVTAGTTADYINTQRIKNDLTSTRSQLEAKNEEMGSLRKEIEALRAENQLLSGKLEKQQGISARRLPAGASIPATTEALEQENQRLRKLTKQLEKTLADVNLRLRNLQQLFDRRGD
jgi:pSer/pThr/pTyr-binding forkhead associated (FHA) protein